MRDLYNKYREYWEPGCKTNEEYLKKKELGELNFVEYFKKLAKKRKASNHDNWMSALNYLESFTNGKLKFADLNESFLNEG